jgi:hypothetical protein
MGWLELRLRLHRIQGFWPGQQLVLAAGRDSHHWSRGALTLAETRSIEVESFGNWNTARPPSTIGRGQCVRSRVYRAETAGLESRVVPVGTILAIQIHENASEGNFADRGIRAINKFLIDYPRQESSYEFGT